MMTFDEAEQQINGQGWTYKHSDGRYDTIWGMLKELRETYAKPIEFGHVDYRTFLFLKEKDFTLKQVLNFGADWDMTEQDLMRAWLNPELIVVKEYKNDI